MKGARAPLELSVPSRRGGTPLARQARNPPQLSRTRPSNDSDNSSSKDTLSTSSTMQMGALCGKGPQSGSQKLTLNLRLHACVRSTQMLLDSDFIVRLYGTYQES